MLNILGHQQMEIKAPFHLILVRMATTKKIKNIAHR